MRKINKRATAVIAAAATLLALGGGAATANASTGEQSQSNSTQMATGMLRDYTPTTAFGDAKVSVINRSADNTSFSGASGQVLSLYVNVTFDPGALRKGDKIVISIPGDAVDWNKVDFDGYIPLLTFYKDSTAKTATFTVTQDLIAMSGFDFTVNVPFLNKATDNNTITASAVSGGVITPVDVQNPHYRTSQTGEVAGSVPSITASDKTLKKGTALGGMNQWLLNGVTANDSEDGNLTNKVSVSNDGGFDPNTNGTYTVTYAVKDSANNTVTKQVKVTVYSDVTVHYADSNGNALQGVKNQDGTAIANPTTISGDGKVGQNYQIPQPSVVRTSDKTYFFSGMTGATSATGTFGDAGQATDVTLSYNLDKTSVVARDVNLIAGTAYDPSLGFVSASDKAGAAVALNNVTVDGASAVDTSKAGTFQVTYSLKNSAGDTVSAVSNVKVIDNSNVTVKDSSIKQGAAWKPEDNFVSAKAADGTDVPFSKMTVTGSVDSSKPGEYDVTYALPALTRGETASEPSHSAVAHVTVVKAAAVTPQPGNGGNASNGGSDSSSNNGSDSSASGNNTGSNDSTNGGNSGNGNSTSSNGGSTSGSNAGGTSASGTSANANSGNGSNNSSPVDSNNAPLSGKPAVVAAGNNANGQASPSAAAKPVAGSASSQNSQPAKPANGLATTGSDVIVPIVVLMVLLAAGSALTVTVVRKRH